MKGGETYEEWDFAAIEKTFWENVGANNDRVDMMRVPSAAAAASLCMKQVHPQTYDVVFIDAAHDYENVKLDIARWWPLVRDGGMLVGHDYNHKWPGVERAVADMLNLMDVGCAPDSLWFVLKQPYMKLREAA